MKKLILVLFSAILTLPFVAKADEWIDLIQVHCVEDMNLFYAKPIRIYYDWPHDKEDRADLKEKLLQEDLLLLPGEFDYSCKLKKATYRIVGAMPPFRAKGQCGSAPRARVTLYENDDMLLDNVFFSPYCHSTDEDNFAYIEEINIGLSKHKSGGYFFAKYKKNLNDGGRNLNLHWGRNEDRTLDQQFLKCIAESSLSIQGSRAEIPACREQSKTINSRKLGD